MVEQDEESVFRIEFHIDKNSEHGWGIKVLDTGNKYEVLNIDTADDAFFASYFIIIREGRRYENNEARFYYKRFRFYE